MCPIALVSHLWNHVFRGRPLDDTGSRPWVPTNPEQTADTYSLDSLPTNPKIRDTIAVCVVCAEPPLWGRDVDPGVYDVSRSIGQFAVLQCVAVGPGLAEYRAHDTGRGMRCHLIVEMGNAPRYRYREWHENDPRVKRFEISGMLTEGDG